MTRTPALLAALIAVWVMTPVGCSDDASDDDLDSDTTDDAATDGDTDADTDTENGTVRVTGNWTGDAPEGTKLRVSIFTCPFTMPPDAFFEGTWDAATGDALAEQDGIAPGEWCLMAYLDIDPTDGLAPVDGLDPVNATGEENAEGALPLTVSAGELTVVDVTFAI